MTSEGLFPARRQPLWVTWGLVALAFVILASGAGVAALFLFSAPHPEVRIVNDTGSAVQVISCSQGKAPTPFDVPAHQTLVFKDWWLTSDDPGFACFVRGSSIGPGNEGACLEMPTGDTRQYEFRASKANTALTQQQCLDRTSPHL